MNTRNHSIPVLFSLLLVGTVAGFAPGCRSGTAEATNDKEIGIRGIYGSPNGFWNKNLRLDELHVNAVFLSHKAIDDSLMERAAREGLRVFAEFPVLNGKDYVDKHPEAWAVDKDGIKVQPATWFMGVCPTDPGFRQYRTTELRKLLQTHAIAGVWMDYLHWHAQFEDPDPILPETCFCEHCIKTFCASAGIEVPEGKTADQAAWILARHDSAWRTWRCCVVADWVRDFRLIVDQERPGALLGIYHCPWNDTDFNGARRRILGLDYDMLRDLADVFSPMVYHGRMGKEPSWVKENIGWFCQRLDIQAGSFPEVWPIVQAYDEPAVVSPEEFEEVLRYGTGACATGVMMFTSHAVAENEAKTAILKKVYAGWDDPMH